MKMHLQNLARVIPSPVAWFWRTAARDLLLVFRRFALYAFAIGLTAVFSLSGQAQEPVPLARGNTPGEPHHHLKIENEYVRVYYVEVPPHEDTQLHQHDHDYIYVSLGPSDVINAILNKPEIHLQLKDGETHFTRGGFAHVARNLADTPFRNITIELLKPQGSAHNLCAQVILNDPLGRCADPAPGYLSVGPQLDTEECRLDIVQLRPQTNVTLHANKLSFLMVALDDSKIRVSVKGKHTKTMRQGEMAWIDAFVNAQFANADNKAAAFLQVAFKDAALRPNP